MRWKKQQVSQATMDAINGSIAKWRKVVKGGYTENCYNDCPLCHLHNTGMTAPCEHCPIKLQTEVEYCCNTPYVGWSHRKYCCKRQANCPDCKRAARAMLRWLYRLRRQCDVNPVC